MLFIWLPGERNPGPDGSVSTSGSVFSVSIFNVTVPSGCFILLEGQNSELQVFERCKYEGTSSLVLYKEAMGGAVKLRKKKNKTFQKAPETVICTVSETNDSFSGSHNI